MARTRRSTHPAGALSWLAGGPARDVLDLAHGSLGFARDLARAGHRVQALERETPVSVPAAGVGVVLGQPENLPFRTARFDVVTSADTLQHFAPGLMLPEIARVLRPGGALAVVCTTRDDTVPWVRRLAAMVQRTDPEAMRGDYGQHAVEAVAESEFFGELERRDFRNWIPVDRDTLLQMVARRPAVQDAPAEERDALFAEVMALYDSLARRPDPLMLPFQSTCWRAVATPRAQQEADEDVLQFSL